MTDKQTDRQTERADSRQQTETDRDRETRGRDRNRDRDKDSETERQRSDNYRRRTDVGHTSTNSYCPTCLTDVWLTSVSHRSNVFSYVGPTSFSDINPTSLIHVGSTSVRTSDRAPQSATVLNAR